MKTGAIINSIQPTALGENPVCLSKINNATLVEHTVFSLKKAGILDIVVVCNKHHKELEKALSHHGIMLLYEPQITKEDSLAVCRVGLEQMSHIDRVLYCPAWVPFFEPETIHALLHGKETVIRPCIQEQPGFPISISSSVFSVLLKAQQAQDLMKYFAACDITMDLLETKDLGVITAATCEEDLLNLHSLYEMQQITPVAKVVLAKGEGFFGPGTWTLLKHIDTIGSVAQAAEKSGFSYSKAWKVIKQAEQGAGVMLVERTAGGAAGGKAKLTNEGIRYMNRYARLTKRVKEATQKAYREIFEEQD